jgi:hypothetical protein
MRNHDIRNLIRASNVRNWQVAEELGIADNTFYVMLRKKLTDEERTRILQAIDTVKRRQQQLYVAGTV